MALPLVSGPTSGRRTENLSSGRVQGQTGGGGRGRLRTAWPDSRWHSTKTFEVRFGDNNNMEKLKTTTLIELTHNFSYIQSSPTSAPPPVPRAPRDNLCMCDAHPFSDQNPKRLMCSNTEWKVQGQNCLCAVHGATCSGSTEGQNMCPFTRPPLSFRSHQGLKSSRSLQAIRTHATNTAQNHCNTLLGCLVSLGTATGIRTRSSLELSSASIACMLNRGLCRKKHIHFNHFHKYRDGHEVQEHFPDAQKSGLHQSTGFLGSRRSFPRAELTWTPPTLPSNALWELTALDPQERAPHRPCAAPADPRSSSESSERWRSAAQQARQHPWAFCARRISQPICSSASNASRTGLSSFSVLVSLGTLVSAPFQWSAPVSRSCPACPRFCRLVGTVALAVPGSRWSWWRRWKPCDASTRSDKCAWSSSALTCVFTGSSSILVMAGFAPPFNFLCFASNSSSGSALFSRSTCSFLPFSGLKQ